MAFKSTELRKQIADNLSFLTGSVLRENIFGLFDSNRDAQDFYKGFLSLIFDYSNLENLDKLNSVTNYPAIDLGDTEAKIAFQITTDKSSKKVKDTIQKFIDHKLFEKYNRLIVLIIGKIRGNGKKKSYVTNFDTQNKFTFNKDTDIWGDEDLIEKIDQLEIIKLQEIVKFMKNELTEFKKPDHLSYQQIKECIEILERDFGSSEDIEVHIAIPQRDNEYIERKNEFNKISLEFFENKIKGHLRYANEIDSFLRAEINRSLKEKHSQVCEAINQYYRNTKKKDESYSFEDVFRAIFQKLNTYDDKVPGLNEKLKILLHHMYFNCDIGESPS